MKTLSALVALLSASLAAADWNYSNSSFLPCSGNVSSTPSADVSSDLYNQLLLSRGYLSRLNLLLDQNNTDLFKFNFNPAVAMSHASRGSGGVAVLASSTTAPALIKTGVSMAFGFLEPCGVNAPHYHPFATQLVAVASGGPLEAGATWDNSAPKQQLTVTVNTYEMVVLPQGSVHYVFNNNCHPTMTVNAFTSDDPGILNIAPTLFKFNSDILNGTLDYPDNLDGYSTSGFLKHVPPSYVLGSEACLKRCGINKNAEGTPPK